MKKFKIMKKTLKYLLIVMGLVSVLSISAQALAQKPEVEMQSTSIMPSTGSNLPSAATTGAVVTGEQPGTYTPANAANTGKRRVRKGWGEGGSDREEPYPDPIGDAAWPLMLLAGVYLIVRGARKRSRALKWSQSDVK